MGPAVFWWGRGIIEHLHHDKDGQKKGKDFSDTWCKTSFLISRLSHMER